MPQLAPLAHQQFFDSNGNPLASGKLYTYITGTSTPKTTYSNVGGTANANPIILDPRGECDIWLDSDAAYRFVLKDSADVTIWTKDDITTTLNGTPVAVATIAALKALTGGLYPTVQVLGYYAAGDGGGGLFRWNSSDATADNGGTVIAPNSGSGRWNRIVDEAYYSVRWFGAKGDDTTDDYSAFAAAYTAAVAAKMPLVLTGATYKLATAWTVGNTRARVVGRGKVILHVTAAGQAVKIDGGAAGGGVYDFGFGGEDGIEIKGNAGTTDILFVRAVHHSNLNVRLRDGTAKACSAQWCVGGTWSVVCSSNETAFLTQPQHGAYFDQRGAGEFCDAITLLTPILEGLSGTGIYINKGRQLVVQGGSSESNNRGMEIYDSTNIVIGLDMEGNAYDDIELAGNNNLFLGVLCGSTPSQNNVEITTGQNNTFIGGRLRVANCQATSSRTLFSGCQLADSVGLGLKGSGSYQNINCVKVDGTATITSKIADAIGEPKQTYTPAYASTGGGAQGATTLAVGTYDRVGGQCFITGNMSIAKGTLGAGAVSVTGLPFASRNLANAYQYIPITEWSNIALGAGYTSLALRISPNGTTAALIKSGTGVASATVAVADFPDPMILIFAGSYEVE